MKLTGIVACGLDGENEAFASDKSYACADVIHISIYQLSSSSSFLRLIMLKDTDVGQLISCKISS